MLIIHGRDGGSRLRGRLGIGKEGWVDGLAEAVAQADFEGITGRARIILLLPVPNRKSDAGLRASLFRLWVGFCCAAGPISRAD